MFSFPYNIEKRNVGRAPQLPEGFPVSQRAYELEMLVNEYKLLAPQRVLEIGTHYGGTLYHWLINAVDRATIVCVDLGPELWQPPDPYFNPQFWQAWKKPGTKFLAIQGNSHDQEVLERVKAAVLQLDFLFIDGDHSYEGVCQDFEMYGPLVRRGGIIALHDLKSPGPPQEHIQVGKLWREIQQAGYITRELYASAAHKWGGIGIVYV